MDQQLATLFLPDRAYCAANDRPTDRPETTPDIWKEVKTTWPLLYLLESRGGGREGGSEGQFLLLNIAAAARPGRREEVERRGGAEGPGQVRAGPEE